MISYKAKIWKDGKHFLAEIKELGLLTQGRTEGEAQGMIIDAVKEYMVSAKDYGHIVPLPRRKRGFEVPLEPKYSFPVILRNLRTAKGITAKKICLKLGYKSTRSYLSYEELGGRIPSIDKFIKFIQAMGYDNPIEDLLPDLAA